MEHTSSDLRIYARLLREARPYWRHLAALLFISLLATPLALLTPLPIKIAIDSVLGSEPLPPFLDMLVPDSLTGSDTALIVLAAALVVVVALLTQVQQLASSVMT